MTATRVLVADDHAVVRAGLRALLEVHVDIEVVAEADCGQQVMARLRAMPVDVVLLDITMPDTVATQCIEEIRKVAPSARVLVNTMHDDALYLRSVFAAGASGYITKSAAPRELIRGIRAVRDGKTFVAAPLAGREGAGATGGQSSDGVGQTRGVPPTAAKLSRRERQVLALLAQGYSYQEMAEALGISANSVGTYRGRIAVKLGVESRADLVRLAFDLGLVARSG